MHTAGEGPRQSGRRPCAAVRTGRTCQMGGRAGRNRTRHRGSGPRAPGGWGEVWGNRRTEAGALRHPRGRPPRGQPREQSAMAAGGPARAGTRLELRVHGPRPELLPRGPLSSSRCSLPLASPICPAVVCARSSLLNPLFKNTAFYSVNFNKADLYNFWKKSGT